MIKLAPTGQTDLNGCDGVTFGQPVQPTPIPPPDPQPQPPPAPQPPTPQPPPVPLPPVTSSTASSGANSDNLRNRIGAYDESICWTGGNRAKYWRKRLRGPATSSWDDRRNSQLCSTRNAMER